MRGRDDAPPTTSTEATPNRRPRVVRVATSCGTSVVVTLANGDEATLDELKAATRKAHELAFPEYGSVRIGETHGYGKFAGDVGLWYPLSDDASFAAGGFEDVMAQVTCERWAEDGGQMEAFRALASPASLTARNRAALATSPLLSVSAVGGGSGYRVTPGSAGTFGGFLTSAGTPANDDAVKRLDLSRVEPTPTPAPAIETPRAFNAKKTKMDPPPVVADDVDTKKAGKKRERPTPAVDEPPTKKTKKADEPTPEADPWEMVEEVEAVAARLDDGKTTQEDVASLLAKNGALTYSVFVKALQSHRGCVSALEKLKMDSFDVLTSTTNYAVQQIGLVQEETSTAWFDDLVNRIGKMKPAVDEDLVMFLAVATLIARVYRSGYRQHKRIPTSLAHGFKAVPTHSSHRFGAVERMIANAGAEGDWIRG
jgi:hypothetical protein